MPLSHQYYLIIVADRDYPEISDEISPEEARQFLIRFLGIVHMIVASTTFYGAVAKGGAVVDVFISNEAETTVEKRKRTTSCVPLPPGGQSVTTSCGCHAAVPQLFKRHFAR